MHLCNDNETLNATIPTRLTFTIITLSITYADYRSLAYLLLIVALVMKIAIPYFKGEVAPCFDVASHFFIYQTEENGGYNKHPLKIDNVSGIENVRRLRNEKIDVLICGGINDKFKYMLETTGVQVISRITGWTDSAFKAFLKGEISGPNEEPIYQSMDSDPSLADLINRSIQLFSASGYRIYSGEQYASFPVDFVAEIDCPICGKPVKAAICCGKHIYRIDEEIREFHLNTGENFNVRIYIQTHSPAVEKSCQQFGIQLIDPAKVQIGKQYQDKIAAIPLIRSPVKGHNKL